MKFKDGDTIETRGGTTLTFSQGLWYDEFGTQWKRTADFDPGIPGISPFETGEWDPSYVDGNSVKHDHKFDDMKDGWFPTEDPEETLVEFEADTARTFLRSLFGVVTSPIYAVLVATIGYAREKYLQYNRD